jgi:hypothetical protein
LTEGAGHTVIPSWLDDKFLYRINYGPAEYSDIKLVQQVIEEVRAKDDKHAEIKESFVGKKERAKITLLDRRIAEKLSRALFSGKDPIYDFSFCTDWKEEDECEVEPYTEMISPFDYGPQLRTTDLLTKCEDFCTQFIWNSDYSSKVLGTDSRPPMAAVAKDIRTLAEYLGRLGLQSEKKVSTVLKEFIQSERICCREDQGSINDGWVVQGLLTDMFKIIIDIPNELIKEEVEKECKKEVEKEVRKKVEKEVTKELVEKEVKTKVQQQVKTREFKRNVENEVKKEVEEEAEGLDKKQSKPNPHIGSERLAVATRWPEVNYFPSGKILRLNELPPLDPSTISPYGSLQDIDAHFILSGPFKINLTNKFGEHFTLNEKKELLVYWEGLDSDEYLLQPFPGRGWEKYQFNTLGRLILSLLL